MGYAVLLAALAVMPALAATPTEREVADWAVRVGGRITLEGRAAAITDPIDLPSGDVRILSLDLTNTVIDPTDLRRLTAYGTLYRALGRLEEMGLLRSRWEDPEIPELAGLNLSWTLTLPTPTQSHKPRLQESTPTTFCVLERRFCDNVEVFYGQDLETGAMFAAEKFSSEREAKEQFSRRKDLKARAACLLVCLKC